jgi:hypothetical protein
MQTKQTLENLRETFKTDFFSLFHIAGWRKSFFSTWSNIIPVIIALLILLVTDRLGLKNYDLVVEVKNLMIGFLPGILGFTVAGYSLMVGFIQAGVLNQITEPMESSKYSLYQKMSATFAINIILQAIALIIAYTIHMVVFIDNKTPEKIIASEKILSVVNGVTLFLVFYWFVISLFLVVQIVVNIFGFSQLHHYFVSKEKIDKGMDKG